VLLLVLDVLPVLLVEEAELCEELGSADEGELEAGGLLAVELDCDVVSGGLLVAFTSLCGMLEDEVVPDVVFAVVAFDSPVALPVCAEPLLQFAEIIFTLATCSVFWPVLVF